MTAQEKLGMASKNSDNKDSIETLESELTLFIKDAQEIREPYFKGLKDVQKALENTFKVFDPSITPKKMYSHDLLAIKEKLLTGTTTPGFLCIDDGSPAEMNRLVTKYVRTVLRKAGYKSIFIGDEGLYDSMYTDGTAFLTIGVDTENKKLQLGHPDISRVYFDKFATNIRRDGSETQSKKVLIVLEMNRDQAIEEYPEIEEMDIQNGRLPGITLNDNNDAANYVNDSQKTLVEGDTIQIGLLYSILGESISQIVAGPSATILPKRTRKGNKYPHYTGEGKNRVDVLPITDFKTYSLRRGIYNPGVMQLMFTLGRIREILDNKAVNYTINNIDDIKIVNIFKGKVDQFFNDYMDAQEDQANGEKGIVVNEYDETEPRGVGRVESLRSDPLTQELERMYARLDQIIRRDGINLDDVFTNPNKTKGAVVLEAEAQVEVIEKFVNRNTPSFNFIVDRTIEFIKQNIGSDDDIIVESNVQMGEESMNITSGIIADWLRDEAKDWYSEINTKSGVNRNKMLQISSIDSMLPGMIPGTKAYDDLVIAKARIQGFDTTHADLKGPGEHSNLPSSNGM